MFVNLSCIFLVVMFFSCLCFVVLFFVIIVILLSDAYVFCVRWFMSVFLSDQAFLFMLLFLMVIDVCFCVFTH